MPTNHAVENVFGTIGTICWTVQLIPQLWKSYRSKSTEGLSPSLVLIWGLSGIPLGTYSVIQNLNIPLIVQPQLFGILCIFSWSQCMYYGDKKPLGWCAGVLTVLLTVYCVLELGFIYAVLEPYQRGEDAAKRGVQFFGIFASVMIAMGLLPQYYEIYKRREVVGISLIFMSVDIAGGIFNDLSLVFKGEFDIIASITYTLVVVMDAAIVLAALILNPIARKRRARLDVEAQSEETSSLSTHGEVNSAEPTSADAGSRLLPLTEPKDSEPGTVNNAITEEPRTLSEKSR
ncbi:PQ-loop-domain-containing protein [Peniophora sp. CONT]|nr:PQ-loop-domain-containing protein [Peniophora sp. CONT]